MKLNVVHSCKNTVLKGGLLAKGAEVAREKMIPYQWDALNDQVPDAEPSHAIENLRIAAGEKSGKYHGMVFQDSDVAKWLEAVAYRLATHPDPSWEAKADSVIDLVARAQQPDGYLNSYYTIVAPEKRWTNLAENHELYCAGHFIEAAVAYYEATGKDKLLKVICKLVEHIDSVFGPEENKKKGYPGHEEIELALVKLYRVTKDERHLKLAQFFVEERGKEPNYFDIEAKERGVDEFRYFGEWRHEYSQSHLPIREQKTAEGHSVRAMYFFSAVADLAQETGDKELLKVCETLWNNTINRRMYITGGIGSQEYGEGFTIDYDLPSDRAYSETCAAIGLFFFAQRMLQINPDRKYADIMERALYNGILSGMSLEGDRFFYVNPLEVSPKVAEFRYDHRHVESTRQGWFSCACCPPNLARLLTSINQYIYGQSNRDFYVHLFADSEVEFKVDETKVTLRQKTQYPWDGKVKIELSLEEKTEFALHVRIPTWCKQSQVQVNGKKVKDTESIQSNGYVTIAQKWQDGDVVELELPMPVEVVHAHPKVREVAGRGALQRGPVVYCLEEVDNGPDLRALVLAKDLGFQIDVDAELHVPAITAQAYRWQATEEDLYTTQQPRKVQTKIKAVPYYIWDNRQQGEMLVWINCSH